MEMKMPDQKEQTLFGIVSQFDHGRGWGFVKVWFTDGGVESFFIHAKAADKEPERFAGVRFTSGERPAGTRKARTAQSAHIGRIVPPGMSKDLAEHFAFGDEVVTVNTNDASDVSSERMNESMIQTLSQPTQMR
jgi:hypothetical protein